MRKLGNHICMIIALAMMTTAFTPAFAARDKTFTATVVSVEEPKMKYVLREYHGDGMSLLTMHDLPDHKVRSDEQLSLNAFNAIRSDDKEALIKLFIENQQEKVREIVEQNWAEIVGQYKAYDDIKAFRGAGVGSTILLKFNLMKDGEVVDARLVTVVRDRKQYKLSLPVEGNPRIDYAFETFNEPVYFIFK